MISKAKIKYLKSLQVKKYRKEEQCFVVEGGKSVAELLRSDFVITQLYATGPFLKDNEDQVSQLGAEVLEVSEEELAAAGTYQTNNAALAVARMKPNQITTIAPGEYVVVLDDIRDPGNAGTIIRAADWYGIKNIIASEETADIYNPKVIGATMGSFCRVNVFYTSLPDYLSHHTKATYGAFLDGTDVHATTFHPEGGYIVMGNEANGISSEVSKLVTHRITIPRYGQAESLNAGVATAIILDNLRRSV
ncbi:MAG: RNA methyltransferase [Flavobacterium psychrophilum]|nr:MAG: RNA methyltransferase [Flavobacterium psychrophilum]